MSNDYKAFRNLVMTYIYDWTSIMQNDYTANRVFLKGTRIEILNGWWDLFMLGFGGEFGMLKGDKAREVALPPIFRVYIYIYIPYVAKRWSHWHVSLGNSLRIRI